MISHSWSSLASPLQTVNCLRIESNSFTMTDSSIILCITQKKCEREKSQLKFDLHTEINEIIIIAQ